MSIVTKFINILKTCLSIGVNTVPSILNAVSPGWGALVGTILNAILNAEATHGPGNGAQKKDAALTAVQMGIPAIVQLIERTSGHELADEVLFADGVAEIQEGAVKVLNAFRVLPKAA